MQSIGHAVEGDHRQDEVSDDPAAKHTYVAAGAATLASFGGLAGVLVGWIMGAEPMSIPGQGTIDGADLLSTTLVAGLLGVGIGALVGALWGLNIHRADDVAEREHQVEEVHDHNERVVPFDYAPLATEPDPAVAMHSVSDDVLMTPLQSANSYRDVEVLEDNVMVEDQTTYIIGSGEEPAMDDRQEVKREEGAAEGQSTNNVTGTQGAIDRETGAYGTAGTPVTTGYGVSGSTIGTGSSQVRDEHEASDFAGSTPDSSSYEMGGRGSDDTPTHSSPDDSSDTPVTEKYKGSATSQAPAPSDPRTQDLYEAGPSYGPEVGGGKEAPASAETSHNSDASLDSPPSSRLINSEETDASAGTNIAGTSDPRGLGDNTDET